MLDEQEKEGKRQEKKIESRKMNEQMAVSAYLLHAFRRKNFTDLDLFFDTFRGSVSVNRNLAEISLKSQYLKD